MTEERQEIVKSIVGILIAIALSFCIINLIWYWGVKLRYDDAIYDLNKVASTEENTRTKEGMCEIVENGYRYRVYDTEYLKSSGFACVYADTEWKDGEEKPERMMAEKGTKVILNIGFKVFFRYSFQISIESAEGKYQIPVDENGSLVALEYEDPKYVKEMNKILDQNREEIALLFSLANNKWNIRK